MQNIQLIENQEVVVVPVARWKRLQAEIVSLRKRLKKAETLNNLRESLTELKRDLTDKNGSKKSDQSIEDFLTELKNDI